MARLLEAVLLFSALCYAYAQSETEDAGTGPQFKFGQKLPPPASKSANYSAKLSFKYETTEKKSIGVYDKVIGRKAYQKLRTYLTAENDAWNFNNYDPEGSNAQRTPDNAPWTNIREPLSFSETKVCRLIVGAVQHRMGITDELYPYRVQGKIIRRGDHTLVSADSDATDEYSAILFMNLNWHKNHYGELYFYDNKREIIAGVTPHGGRLVVWESSILKLNRPPGVSFKQGQLIFNVIFSKSRDKMLEASQSWYAFRQERTEAYKSWYLPDVKVPDSIDMSKHVVRNYTTKQDFKIFVFDNLFPREMLDKMRAFVLKYGSYFYDDSLDDETSDNVQWIAGFSMQEYIQGAYWKIVKQVANFATGSKKFFPYDVSINLIRNADHTKIHEDCSPDEREWTFLLYLTPNWTQNYYGETVFLDRNSDDTDIAAEVLPKYGRVAIFQGNIPHSARPPSLNYTGVRLTFANKLSETEFIGRRKNLQEEIRHFNSLEATLNEAGIGEFDSVAHVVEDLKVDEALTKSRRKDRYLEEELVVEEDVEEDGDEPKRGSDQQPNKEVITEEVVVEEGDLPEGVTAEMYERIQGMISRGKIEEATDIPAHILEEVRQAIEGGGEPEDDSEEDEDKSSGPPQNPPKKAGKYAPVAMDEEEESPPITEKLNAKLDDIMDRKNANEAADLYDKMKIIRDAMSSKRMGAIMNGL